MKRKHLSDITARLNANKIALIRAQARGSGHIALVVTDGAATATVFCSATPSCPYAMTKTVADARRALEVTP